MGNRFFKGLSSFGTEAVTSNEKFELKEECFFMSLDEHSDATARRDRHGAKEPNQVELELKEKKVKLEQLMSEMRNSAPFLGGPPGWV